MILYSIINYDNLRFVAMILIIITLFWTLNLVNEKILKKKINYLNIRVIVFVIAAIISFFFLGFPYEQMFLKFNNYNDAFKYNFPKGSIYKSFEGDDYVYLLYKTKKSENPHHLVHYVKKNNRWLIIDSYSAELNQCRITSVNDYVVNINKISDDNLAVLVTYESDNGKTVTIGDLVGSSFQTFSINDKSSDAVYYASIAIIDKKIDNDYTITIDGYEYAPFKDKNGDRFFRFLPFDFN